MPMINGITAIKNLMSTWDDFVNPGLANEEKNTALAKAIQHNSCSDAELDQLEDILFSPEKSEQFFNDPVVQKALLQGLIANTRLDERIIAGMKTCTPCLFPTDQEEIFNHQFSWALNNPSVASNLEIALRFFTQTCTETKFTPYRPTKYSDQNFNCDAKFSGSDDLIVCRHLATQVLLNELNPDNLKISYDNFRSTEDITQQIQPDIEAKFKRIKSNATEAHLITNANWGQFVIRQFVEMEQQGVQTKRMLVESTAHGMAAWLRVKEKEGRKCYVVHFYDPNLTTTHARAKSYDLVSMKHWTLGAFINIDNKQREQLHYPETQAVSMLYVVPESEKFNSPNQQPAQVISHSDRKLTSHNVGPTAMFIHHLMASGFAGTLKEIVNQIKTLPQSGADLLELLSAKRADGVPGLHMALQNGHFDAIRAYGELLQAAEISGADLLSLISARREDGTPGLFFTLQNGDTNAIRAYGKLLKAAGISGTDLLNLLNAKDKDGNPGFYFALQYGHTDAIRAYGELLQAAEISRTDLIDLLSARRADGIPGLHMALQKGHVDTIRAYGELLQATGISGTDLLELLSAKDAVGNPGLYMVLQLGHADTIRAYGELLQAAGISGTDLRDLLSAKRIDGLPGLSIALQKGHTDAIRAYGELLQAAEISGTDLLNLLSTRRADNVPGLSLAFKHGHPDAVLAYCELIRTIAPSLHQGQKTLLLTTLIESHSYNDNDTHGFFEKRTHYDFYTQFKKAHPDVYRQFKATKNALKT